MIAHPGDTVLVARGRYPETDAQSGATGIHAASKSQPVTFVCGGNGDVTFASADLCLLPGNVRSDHPRRLFQFHVPTFGFGGDAERTHDVTPRRRAHGLLRVSRLRERDDSSNSEVGPVVACGGPSYSDAHSRCDPANPVEAYYASRATARRPAIEPFIHNGAPGRAVRFALIGNRIHGIQTKNSGVWHTGGLLVWDTDGLVIRGNTFDHDAIYDIEENADSIDTNLTIESNVFGWPVNPLDGDSGDGQETAKDWREFDLGGAASLSNALIRFNNFAHGALFRSDGPFDNVQVVGNVLGSAVRLFSWRSGRPECLRRPLVVRHQRLPSLVLAVRRLQEQRLPSQTQVGSPNASSRTSGPASRTTVPANAEGPALPRTRDA